MKERIIRCAVEQFGLYGMKGLAMDTIASRLGISKRTLYEYFPCKENLLEVCLQSRLNERQLLVATDGNLLDELIALYIGIRRGDFRLALRFCREAKRFHASVYRTLSKRLSDYAAECGRRVYAGIDEGYIHSGITADTVDAAVWGYLKGIFFDTDTDSIRQDISPETIIIFSRGLCTAKGRDYLDRQLKTIA